MNITTHIMVGHKGGIGKSFCCVQLASYLKFKGVPYQCFDTDAQNATLSAYKKLAVMQLPLLDAATKTINTRNFDRLFEKEIPSVPENGHVVIDIGSGTYLPFLSYLLENPGIPMLQSMGAVQIHTVLTGGQAFEETLSCLELWIKHFPLLPYVVWENQFFGPVGHNENSFRADERYQTSLSKALSITEITIPLFNPDTFGRDLKTMLTSYMTVDEASKSAKFGAMSQHRLLGFQRTMFAALDDSGAVEVGA